VVAQAAVGQGSWVFFFGMVENLGERSLAISNLARTVYLLLSIPLWGFSTGVNTLVSNLIGQGRKDMVLSAAWKTGKLCWLVTMLAAVPILLFPGFFLYPFLGKEDMSLIVDTQPVFHFLLWLLTFSTFGAVLLNALSGTGATMIGLKLQALCVTVYLGYIYWATNFISLGLIWVWAAEWLYWAMMTAMVFYYLRSEKWHHLSF
jgi:Na+-driven multidrug efflux pump